MAVQPAIQSFADNMNGFLSRLESSIQGLGADVKGLNAKIAQLQSTQGAISAEDQGILDSIQALAHDAVSKFEALDALTPPDVPAPAPAPAPAPSGEPTTTPVNPV